MEVNPFGPLQEKVALPTFEVARTVTEGFAQVIVLPVATALGGVLLAFTIAVEVLEQPSFGLVIVSAYVPVTLTIGLAKVEVNPFGPVHW